MATDLDDAPAVTRKDTKPDRELTAAAVTINRSADELFAFYRAFTNLPNFMENVVRIDALGGDRTHWVVKAPGGKTVEWDARVTNEVPGKVITWQSEDGADVPNSGRVTFAEAGARGTVVTATIAYDPPAGAIGKLIAKMFQREPAIQARRDLRRFKQLMETGEIATPAMNAKQFEEMGL
ncbi:SRPBCC family protein [Sphingomonas sp. 3P27F8]|uniref:SRPBCC family protein n=1 Tax=Sphingomonas sp. 3P27F8 TaxID=2502213 RepID=UPI0010F96380|nr:SRPBCC family protein [Sphingomonas sp. 3P27F8]